MIRSFIAASAAFIMMGATSVASASEYYSGKTVTILVGAGASGGTSMYGHLVKQFLGKHLPGNPKVIVQNKQGGGGIKMGNLLASG